MTEARWLARVTLAQLAKDEYPRRAKAAAHSAKLTKALTFGIFAKKKEGRQQGQNPCCRKEMFPEVRCERFLADKDLAIVADKVAEADGVVGRARWSAEITNNV